jgi:hypothetical protein
MTADLKVEIPHVWFDIIGRVIPGAFLIVGLGAEGYFPDSIKRCIFDPSVPTLTLTFILLVYISAAFTAGFLLGPLGCILDCAWNKRRPLRLEEFSGDTIKLLEDEFKVSKEESIDRQNQNIWRARLTAVHILWTRPTALSAAALVSKRDAEKLASSSLAWAGLVLMGGWVAVWTLSCFGIGPHEPFAVRVMVLAVLSVVVVMSLFAYDHYRKRVVETPLDALAEIRYKPMPDR